MEQEANAPRPAIRAHTLAAWRAWLKTHHSSERVVWLIFPKGATGPSVTYNDALDEALCWGWIDSIIKRIDDTSYSRKFTPRTNAAKWSAANINRMKSLVAAGRVQIAGMAVVSPEVLERIKGGISRVPKKPHAAFSASPDLDEALSRDAVAKAFFAALAPSYKRNYLGWVASAKQPETRKRRAQEAARLLAKGVKALLK